MITIQRSLLAALFLTIFTLTAQAGDSSKMGGSPKDPDADRGPSLDRCNNETHAPSHGTVAKMVDGDTFHVRTSQGTFSVRMLGMDTPETHFMGKTQGYWGDKAADVLADLMPVGSAVTLEYESLACDSHGRLLAHAHTKNSDGEMFHVNAEMVKQGLAVNYCVAPDFRYCEELSRLTQKAIDSKQGMFSEPDAELPYDFRRRIQNNPQRSFIGDIQTKEVRSPGHQNEVPVANRVFFYTRQAVQPPYHVIDEQR